MDREPPGTRPDQRVGKAAAEAGLGVFRQAFPGTRVELVAAGAQGLFGLTLGAIAGRNLLTTSVTHLGLGGITLSLLAAIGAVLLTGLGVRRFRSRWARGQEAVYLFEHGLVHAERAQVSAWAWGEVAGVGHRVVHRWRDGRNVAVRQVCVLRARDGRRLALEHFHGIGELTALVAGEVVGRLLPSALERVRGGGGLRFGPIRLDRDGIGDEDAWVGWEQLRDLTVDDGRVYVNAADEESGFSAALHRVENFALLVAVVEELVGEPGPAG